MNNDPAQAAALAESGLTDALLKTFEDETGLAPTQIKAVMRAILTRNLDELDVLAVDAALQGGTLALWETARQSKTVKVQAIERRAGSYGFKPDDVKAVFVAVVEDPQIQTAVAAMIQGDLEPAKTLAYDASLDQVRCGNIDECDDDSPGPSPTALPHRPAHVHTTRPSTSWRRRWPTTRGTRRCRCRASRGPCSWATWTSWRAWT